METKGTADSPDPFCFSGPTSHEAGRTNSEKRPRLANLAPGLWKGDSSAETMPSRLPKVTYIPSPGRGARDSRSETLLIREGPLHRICFSPISSYDFRGTAKPVLSESGT